MMAGVDMVHVPYRGQRRRSPTCSAARCRSCSPPLPSSIEHIKAGKLRGAGGHHARRARRRCPTCRPWPTSCRATRRARGTASARRKDTPAEIVDKLNKEINAGLADPKLKARLADLGGTVLAGSPAEFGKLIADETEKWGKVIRAANIKL